VCRAWAYVLPQFPQENGRIALVPGRPAGTTLEATTSAARQYRPPQTTGIEGSCMRRYLLAVTTAGMMGIAAAPAAGGGVISKEEAETAVPVQSVAVESFGLRDEAMMVLVGSALIGIAAAVRRTA
jgi:hypothetical protein